MSSDINIILQLLQRQLSQVPPAYSPISPSSHTLGMYSTGSKSLDAMQPCPSLQAESPMSSVQSSSFTDYVDLEKFNLKSKDSVSSGIHLTVESDETITMFPEQDPILLPNSLELRQLTPHSQGLYCGSRFPSLPEHLGASTSVSSDHIDFQRHLSDPGLPGS